MRRRLIGGLLFVVVLTLAVLVPALGGLRSEGVGTAIELPSDPRVGDCVLEPPTDSAVIPPAASVSMIAPSFAPCDGQPIAGEVVAVVRAAGDDRARLQQVAAIGEDCRGSSLKYSGLVQDDGRYVLADHHLHDVVDWNLSINARTSWVLPPALLRSAGQTWAACIAAPASAAAYRGRLVGAFTDGVLPDEFGVCWEQTAPPATIDSVSCGDRHLAELVSTGKVPDGGKVTVADIKVSCQQLAAKVIGRADPTAGGQLVVGTAISPDTAQFLALPQPLNVTCYVAPVAQSLSGTLVGLGNRPIPYSK